MTKPRSKAANDELGMLVAVAERKEISTDYVSSRSSAGAPSALLLQIGHDQLLSKGHLDICHDHSGGTNQAINLISIFPRHIQNSPCQKRLVYSTKGSRSRTAYVLRPIHSNQTTMSFNGCALSPWSASALQVGTRKAQNEFRESGAHVNFSASTASVNVNATCAGELLSNFEPENCA
ncbi:hypothetical protein B0H34DRAFT_81114 [Crassisporium funariophilum]|nr:hypothetical protein B0H34DRAFT_81114 [Crassisporium funariophilum]